MREISKRKRKKEKKRRRSKNMRRWPSSFHHPSSSSSPHIPHHHALLPPSPPPPPPPTVINTATSSRPFHGDENAAGGGGGSGWLDDVLKTTEEVWADEMVKLADFGMPHHPGPPAADSSLPDWTEFLSSSAPPTAAPPEAEVANPPLAAEADGSGGEEVRRTKGVPWSLEEHKLFLLGLRDYKKGDWKSISRKYIITRSPSQVASHAQKYFRRRQQKEEDGWKEKRRRSSIHDVTHVDESSERELIDKGRLVLRHPPSPPPPPPQQHSHDEQVNNTSKSV